jgi:lipopolysaccharide transport system ATP-binding protein
MAVRLGFAVAAHLDVEILVVDEALAVGDFAFQRKCLSRMAGAARDGRTVLFVSHDLAAIASLTGRAICLEAGSIVAAGATPDVVAEYLARSMRRETGDGYALLAGRARPDAIVNSEAVRLDWVRTTDRAGGQCAAFREGEPIAVEFGFTVVREAANLEFISGVASVEQGVVLFLVSSPKYAAPVGPGTYALGLRIDPNFLRAGAYSLGFKVFADGARADTMHDALRFDVIDAAVPSQPPGEYHRWDGHMRFDYAWGQIARRHVGAV